jgi:hypothetical protein
MELLLLFGSQTLAAVRADENVVIALGRGWAGATRAGIDALNVAPGVEGNPDHERQPGHDQ